MDRQSPSGAWQSKDTDFLFFSFLQCKRPSQSGSHSLDSGISPGHDDDVVLISDDDTKSTHLELLCEVQYDGDKPMPQPIEQKFLCKTETLCVDDLDGGSMENRFDTLERSALSACEDELRPVCKLESEVDLTEQGNDYILYVCPQCGIAFNTNREWQLHITAAHNLCNQRSFNFTQRPNNQFECNKCLMVITRCTLKTLQQHRFTHLPYKVYNCKMCRYESGSLFLMISHIMVHKDCEELQPKAEDEHEEHQNAVLSHESGMFIAYICPACGVKFDTEDTWQAHINFRHNFLEKTAENRFEDHFKCSDCGVEIFSQHTSDLQQHLFTHLPYKSFLKCKVCDWTNSRRSFMISHILNLHKDRLKSFRVTPPTPETPSPSIDEAVNAKRTEHNSIALLRLREDSFEFTEPEDVSLEESICELDIKRPSFDFRCPHCPCIFGTEADRRAHKMAAHAKYKCVKCQQSYVAKADFKRHACPKLTPQVLQCEVCYKDYNYEKCYLNHVRRCRANSFVNRKRN